MLHCGTMICIYRISKTMTAFLKYIGILFLLLRGSFAFEVFFQGWSPYWNLNIYLWYKTAMPLSVTMTLSVSMTLYMSRQHYAFAVTSLLLPGLVSPGDSRHCNGNAECYKVLFFQVLRIKCKYGLFGVDHTSDYLNQEKLFIHGCPPGVNLTYSYSEKSDFKFSLRMRGKIYLFTINISSTTPRKKSLSWIVAYCFPVDHVWA